MKHTEVGYGFCCCDPRDFKPDPECSTEEERQRHANDCAALERGEEVDRHTGCWNTAAGHGYGLGSYSIEWDCEGERDCPECRPRGCATCGAIAPPDCICGEAVSW